MGSLGLALIPGGREQKNPLRIRHLRDLQRRVPCFVFVKLKVICETGFLCCVRVFSIFVTFRIKMKKLLGQNLLKPAIYVMALVSVFLILISSIDVHVSWFVEDIIDAHYDPRPKSMEMHLRKLRVLQTCKKYGSVLKAPEMLSKRNTLIWDLKDKLIYCRIAKVASSTW